MSQVLTIKNTLLSSRGEMIFYAQNGQERYTAKGEFSFFNPGWTLFRGHHEIARIKKKLWSWSTKYLIESTASNFILRRKSWSWTRKYLVLGGQFDGAVITGGFWDTSFEMHFQGRRLLQGDNELISLRDTCHVTLYEDTHGDELAAILVALRLDKKSNESGGAAGGGD